MVTDEAAVLGPSDRYAGAHAGARSRCARRGGIDGASIRDGAGEAARRLADSMTPEGVAARVVNWRRRSTGAGWEINEVNGRPAGTIDKVLAVAGHSAPLSQPAR
jgi:hypothetical protein